MGKKSNRSRALLLVVLAMAFSLLLSACAQATEPPTAQPEVTTAATEQVATVEATPTESKPVDITLWAQATVTESGPPPADWIAYKTIKDELNINLTYV